MLRKVLGSMAIAVALIGFATADEEGARDKNKQGQELKGTVAKVDAQANTLTVRVTEGVDEKGERVKGTPEGQARTFRLPENIKVVGEDGKQMTLQQLQPGDKVCIRHEQGRILEVKKEKKDREGGIRGGAEKDRQ